MLKYSVKNIIASGETPLVLLHGFLESSTMWENSQIPIGYPVVKVDLPGHGKSSDPDLLRDSIEEMAKSVIEVMNELGLTTYHLVGHSMGGYVGLEMKRLDDRLSKLMLLNSNFWSDSAQKVKDRIRVAEIVQTNKSHFIYEVIPNLFVNPEKFDADVKGLIAEALEMSPDSIAKASIAMSRRTDHTDFVRENSKDFTIVQGEEDPIVSLAQMRDLLKGSDANYIELEEVGHMAHFEAREQLNNLISDFIK
ncbi:MAG: alpha/beta hydrolase [Crocinitomicaceae bacterium]|nr:alpha/beta hydrolase [Crocinitomicaceae bacterium]